MPRSYKARSFKRRKRGFRKRRSKYLAKRRAFKRSRLSQTRLLRGPVNRTCIAKLRYCETFQLTPAASVIGSYVFRANDLYDSNFTGTGHQSMGFDEIMANYQHFTVIGSKITCTFNNANASGSSPPYLAAVSLNSSSNDHPTNTSALKERARTRYKLVGNPYGASGQTTLTYKFSAKRFFHVKAIVGESQYKGTVGASPSEQAFFYIYVANDPQNAAIGTINCSVMIQYYAIFSEPKTIGQS